MIFALLLLLRLVNGSEFSPLETELVETEAKASSPHCAVAEILKVVSVVSMLVLFFCPCCANFWSVYAHRMCIGAYFWLQLC